MSPNRIHPNLEKLYQACEPDEAANAEYWTDCSKGRGGNILVDTILPRLNSANSFVRVLFTGHVGGGKSSELFHFAAEIEKNEGELPFLPIYVDADEYFARSDANLNDIYLPLVAEIAAVFRDKEEVRVELSDSYFTSRFNEIKSFFLTDVEVSQGEFNLGLFKGKINRLRDSAEARSSVRNALSKYNSTLPNEFNLFLDEARRKLKTVKKPDGTPRYRDFVLIVDNLEKIRQIKGFDEGEKSLKAFFVDNSQVFGSIKAHAVFTIPLQIARSHGAALSNDYEIPPIVLPIVKVCERIGDQEFVDGYECLRTILTKRINGATWESVIQKDALDFLIRYSGGHIRYFIRFLHNAAARARQEKIDRAVAEQAVIGDYTTFDAAVRTEWIDQILAIVRDEDHHADTQSPNILEMLELSILLEYYNSGKNMGRFQSETYWYAPHPLVTELNRYIRQKQKTDSAALPTTS